ncbi:MAG: sigma-70 factor domain-containing protein, partial [Candidatus Binatia bacterium]
MAGRTMAEAPDKPDWPGEGDENKRPAEEVEAAADLAESEESDAPASDTALAPREPLQRYLAEIRRYPLLTPEEEHRLAVEYKEYGDLRAAYRLVTANLRLVVMIARRYENAFRNLFDLIQEGNI